MAQIKLELSAVLVDGMDVKFKAPCDCEAVTGLLVSYINETGATVEKSFTFRDKHGRDITGLGNLFSAGAYVMAMLDTRRGHAYLPTAGSTIFQTYVELPTEAWVDNSQTVALKGVTADNPVFISAAPENLEDYCAAGIRCIAQDTEQLTFACSRAPAGVIRVNVGIST